MHVTGKYQLFLFGLLICCSSKSAEFSISSETLKPLEDLSIGLIPRDDDGCLISQPEILQQEKSAVTSILKPDDTSRVFVDLQFMAIGKNGEQTLQSMSVPRLNLRNFFTKYSLVSGVPREDLVNMPEDQLLELINSQTFNITGIARSHAVDNALLIHRLSKITDENLLYSTLVSEMKSESYAKKIDFLANFLSYLNDNYDITSFNSGSTKDIRVSDMELMKGIRDAIATGKPVEAGVCRHMHQLALKMAHAMGIENAYTIGYQTTKLGHMNMVIQDPSDPKKVIQLNYGQKTERVGMTGPEVLSQDHSIPSTGLTLRIYNYKSEHAITLPTEEGAILNRVTGGDDKSLSPDYKSKSQFRQAGVQTSFGTVRFFQATSPMGNQGQTSGGAYNVKLNYNDLFYGEYGVAGFFSQRPADGDEIQTRGLYGRITQGFKAKVFESEDFSASVFGELNLKGSAYCANFEGKDCGANFDGDASLIKGVEANYTTSKINHRTSVVLQSQVAENSALQDQPIVLSLPVTQLVHDSNFRLSSRINANVGGDLTFYHLGPGTHATYSSRVGFLDMNSKSFFQMNLDGRLTENTPIWIPDAEQSLGGTVGTTFFGDRFYLNFDGRKSLENDGNYYLGIGVGGSLSSKDSE